VVGDPEDLGRTYALPHAASTTGRSRRAATGGQERKSASVWVRCRNGIARVGKRRIPYSIAGKVARG
jgi:hypothetical protein